MKNVFSKLLIAGLIATAPLVSMAADGTPVVKKSTAKSDKTKVDAKDEAKDAASNSALIAILNQIVLARLDFDIDLGMKVTQKKGEDESKTAIDFKYLDISAMIKFKDQLVYNFVDEAKANAQIKKVIPAIRFSTKEMYVVAKVKTETAGKMKLTVRFCQNYSINNDFCNTLEDKKLLDISVNSVNFGMFDMRIKDITLDFEQKLAEGKFSFKGNCTAWKSAFDIETPDKTVMKPATCEFGGTYDSKAEVKFDGNFKLRSKKQ